MRCTRLPTPFARSRFAVSTRRVLGEVGLADRGTSRSSHQRSASTPNRCDEVDRVDRVAERLADLAAVRGHVVVHEQLGRERQPGREQDRGPDQRVEADDALADHVPPDRRRARHHSARRGAEVVDERVEPDVDDLVGIAGHRDPPVARAGARPRDADVADVGREERRAPRCGALVGLDAQLRRSAISARIALRVAREPEEPVLLLDPLERRVVLVARAPSTNSSQPAQYQPAYGAR